jgi:wyosine [tRNA(Phe)-imidazoG37] synthetase (radical SAM superfamily)
MQVERQAFYEPEKLLEDVEKKITEVLKAGESIDYLTFVPDGEPSLDVNLGREIDFLKPLGFKIAVITNASLIWREDVRSELTKADWVSLKVDAVNEDTWRRIDRPHRVLDASLILDGMNEFARIFNGEFVTETVLVKGINDGHRHAEEVAEILARLKPKKAYLSIPTRPPAETWVQPPEEDVLNAFYQILDGKVKGVEYLIGYEGNRFTSLGNVEEDLLGITAVHPMREEAVREFLARARADWSIIQRLIAQGMLLETEYEKNKYYMRRPPGRIGGAEQGERP